MGLYELMFIVRQDLEAEENEALLQGLQDVITKQGGDIKLFDSWGLRRLAYEIKKLNDGRYYLLYFQGSSDIIPELEHYFRVNDTFLRYMVVIIEQSELDAALAKARQAEEAKKKQKEKEEEAAAPVVVEETAEKPQEQQAPASSEEQAGQAAE